MNYKCYFQTNGRAQLLCSGHVDAVDLGIDVGRYCQHVLVIAGDDRQVYHPSASGEWELLKELAYNLGSLPLYFPDEHIGKVVGTLEVIRAPHLANTTPWTYGNECPDTVYRIVSASLLTVPCALELIADRNVLRNAYHALLPMRLFTNTLLLPLNDALFESIGEGETLALPFVGCLRELLLDGDRLVPYKYVTLTNGNRQRTFKTSLEREVFPPCLGAEEPGALYSKFRNEPLTLEYVVFHFGTKF